MSARVAALWRHPIKSHGREALDKMALTEGEPVPWDRHWAVLHDNARAEGDGWADCANFMIGTRTPGLAGLWAKLDAANRRVALRHDQLGDMSLAPDDAEEAKRLFAWLAPLLPENRAQPRAIVKAPGRGMTDTDYPSVSIMNMASHKAVAERLGQDIAPERWRGNIWLEGLAPWAEWEWIGKDIRIGSAVLRLREPIERCLHTAANPKTGERDADTLGTLRAGWGHNDFGVYAEVVEGGEVTLNNAAAPA